ncbi:MAG TPA: HEAT repeat domain-containing protein [Desulfobacteraceae bacterium]|nr:HEAT repeat domain-containing protein [Desulfobacteraceae bacterium]HPQ27394.1 HEAT repeat domain-containing protein [Desulfobacteraceae bacterium]
MYRFLMLVSVVASLIACQATQKRSLDVLAEDLTVGSGITRHSAVVELEKSSDPKAIGILINALSSNPDWQVRSRVAEALGKLKDPRAVEPLISALWDVTGARYQAIVALGKLKDSRAIVPLIGILENEENATVRKSIIHSIGEIRDPRGITFLLAKLKNAEGDLEKASAESALIKIGPPALETLISALKGADQETTIRIKRVLGSIVGSEAVEPLIAVLSGQGSEIGVGAAEGLRKLTDIRDFELLLAALRDRSWIIRSIAARAMGDLKDHRAIQPLTATMRDNDWRVRKEAVAAASDFWKIMPVEPLLLSLKDSNSAVRAEAAKALYRIADPQSVEPLITALRDEDWYVRKEAAVTLCSLNDESVLIYSKGIQKDVAVAMLSRLNDQGVISAFTDRLDDENKKVQAWAAKGLWRIKKEIAHATVIEWLAKRAMAMYAKNSYAERAIKNVLFNKTLVSVAKAYPIFIGASIDGSEWILDAALNAYGTRKMAEDFINSGPFLRRSGEEWAYKHGYDIVPGY